MIYQGEDFSCLECQRTCNEDNGAIVLGSMGFCSPSCVVEWSYKAIERECQQHRLKVRNHLVDIKRFSQKDEAVKS